MRSRRVVNAIIVLITVTLGTQHKNAAAQESAAPGTFGLSASLQSGEGGILVPIFAGRHLAVVPSVTIAQISDSYTDWIVGIAFRAYQGEGKFRPYVAGRFAVAILAPSGNDKQTDYLLGPAAGGEYWFDRHFSVGVEAQVNVTLTDEGSFRFGAADRTIINTATAAFATVYF